MLQPPTLRYLAEAFLQAIIANKEEQQLGLPMDRGSALAELLPQWEKYQAVDDSGYDTDGTVLIDPGSEEQEKDQQPLTKEPLERATAGILDKTDGKILDMKPVGLSAGHAAAAPKGREPGEPEADATGGNILRENNSGGQSH